MGKTKRDETANMQLHKKAKASPNRQVGTRGKRVRFLIICGGEKTEPLYFEALKNKIIKNDRSIISGIAIKGCRMAPLKLVDKALEEKSKQEREGKTYNRIWIVFDKDKFKDFNKAISKAQKEKFECAWSNISFELWFCLHFEDIGGYVSVDDCIDRLEKFLGDKKKKFEYDKSAPNIYTLLQEHGNEEDAKKRAKELCERYNDKNYAEHNPCTTVYKLVEELEHPECIQL